MITLCSAQHHQRVVEKYEKTKMGKSGGYDKMSGSVLLAVILLLSSHVTEVHCMELCVPTTGTVNSTHKVPEISGSYVTFMEWWELDSTSVTYREEYVDDEMNMAAFRIYGLYDPGDVYTYISDYNSGQLFTIAETAEGLCSRCKKACTASSVDSKGANTFAFTKINNTDHIAKTPFLLSFGKSLGEQYVGEGVIVRGKRAVMWKSCQTDTATNVTTQVMFYVTDEGWTSATTSSPVPVMSDMTKLIPGIPPEPDIEIATRIDFVFFQNYITDRSIFQAHVDIFCEGRKETKPVPVIPNHFRFRAERIITHLNEVGAYDEWYNEDSKVIRIDSKPMPGNMAILDLSTRTEILDFNMGISFLIMQDTGYCTVTPIMPEEFNAKLTDPNHVALKSPEEFFHFDSGNFTYSGRTTVREIETDVWIGKRTDFPLGETSTSIWKWYFSTDEWSVSQFGEPLKNVPVLLKIDLPDKDLHYLYNMYDFTPQDPDLVHFDVSACYKQTQFRNLQFSIIGNPDIATKLPKLFNYQLSLRLTEIMHVSLLRISHLQTEFYDRGAFVTFTLLDPPEFKGDVAGTVDPSALLSSETAVQNLDSFLNQGTILLHFHANNVNANNVSSVFVSIPSSLVDVVRFLDGRVEKLSDQSTTSAINHISQNVTTSSIKSSSQVSSSTTTSSTVTSNKQLSTAPTAVTKGEPPAVTKGEPPARITRETLQPVTSSTDDTSTAKCSIDNQKSEQTQEGMWTTTSVAGLAVGLTFFGIILGMVLMMVVRRLFFMKQPNNGMEEATGLNYMRM